MIYDQSLLNELDAIIADMHESNQDLVISIFGREGSGKSSLAESLAVFLDRTLNADNLHIRLAQTCDDFAMKAPNVNAFEVIWWDEAHRFSKRGSFDTEYNRILLEYFQDIRGRKRIYILCFPELREIDRKVVQRTRLWFETVKNGKDFLVKGWRQDQIDATIACYRLPSPKTQALKWVGLSKYPVRVFRHDYKDFISAQNCSTRHEPIASVQKLNEAYKSFKEGSLRRSDENLRQYGAKDAMDVCNEIMRRTQLGYEQAKEIAYGIVKEALKEGWGESKEIEQVNGKYRIRNITLFEKIVLAGLDKTSGRGHTNTEHKSMSRNESYVRYEKPKIEAAAKETIIINANNTSTT